MEILFVPEVPTQEQLNRTWPGTQEKMYLRVYGKTTHADAIRYTDPGAMVAVPQLTPLFQQEQRTTGQVTVIHNSPTRPDQFPLHEFDYVVESPVVQVTGQVRFRPLQPLDLERGVGDDTWERTGRSFEPVTFKFPNDSEYKGLRDVRFDAPSTPASDVRLDVLGE